MTKRAVYPDVRLYYASSEMKTQIIPSLEIKIFAGADHKM